MGWGKGVHHYSFMVLEILLEKLVNLKIYFTALHMSYNESLYDQIIQHQVDLNPFLARKRVGC